MDSGLVNGAVIEAIREETRIGEAMPDETGTVTIRSDVPSVDESLFGNAAEDGGCRGCR